MVTDEERYLADGSLLMKVVCTLDAFGRVTEKTTFETPAPAQKLAGRETYRYDAQGRLQQVERFEGDGTPLNSSAFDYDERGRLLRERITPSEGGAPWTMAYVYDEKGQPTSFTCTGPDAKEVWKHLYRYDEGGRVAEDKAYPRGQLISNTRYTYDNRGDLTKLVRYRGDDQLIVRHTFRSTYDAKGNWIRRVTYDTRFFKPRWVEAAYRVITYYP